MKVYWWKDVPNFGDSLTRLLLEKLNGATVEWADPKNAEVFGAGSILEHVPSSYSGNNKIILGSGAIKGSGSLAYLHADVRAVRGPMSARLLGKPNAALGDPGLLAYKLVGERMPEKTVDLGVVPHWRDGALAHDKRWFGDFTTDVIYPTGDPLDVLMRIARCRKIVTTSLHGLIVADGMDIPRRLEWTPELGNDREGNYFKFNDYNASIGMKTVFGEVQHPRHFPIEDRQQELLDAFEGLRN